MIDLFFNPVKLLWEYITGISPVMFNLPDWNLDGKQGNAIQYEINIYACIIVELFKHFPLIPIYSVDNLNLQKAKTLKN